MNPFDKPPKIVKYTPGEKMEMNTFSNAMSCDRCGMLYPRSQLKGGKASGRPGFCLICPACAYTAPKTKKD